MNDNKLTSMQIATLSHLKQSVGKSVRLQNQAGADQDFTKFAIDLFGTLEESDEGTYYIRVVENFNGVFGVNFSITDVQSVTTRDGFVKDILLN